MVELWAAPTEPFTRTGAGSQLPLGSHDPTAPPTSGKDLPPGKKKVCMAFSASLVPFKPSGLGKALLSHPYPAPTIRICFSQLKKGASHRMSPKKQFLCICFPLKQHHLPDGVGSVKVLKLCCGGFLHKSGGVNHGGMAQLQLRSHHSALPLLWQPGQRTPHCLNSCLASSGRWLPFSPGRRAHLLDSLHNN